MIRFLHDLNETNTFSLIHIILFFFLFKIVPIKLDTLSTAEYWEMHIVVVKFSLKRLRPICDESISTVSPGILFPVGLSFLGSRIDGNLEGQDRGYEMNRSKSPNTLTVAMSRSNLKCKEWPFCANINALDLVNCFGTRRGLNFSLSKYT